MQRPIAPLIGILLVSLGLSGCNLIPFLPGAPTTTEPPGTLVYDAPVSLTVKNGTSLQGTQIAYGGKTQTGAAKLLLAGLVAAKQTGDSLDWQGTPVPNTLLQLATRVMMFDDKSVTLVGTAHVEVKNVTIQSGGTPSATGIEISAPVSYNVGKAGPIPGTKVTYVGSTDQGAQFSGVEGYPYRKELDSLEYVGRINPKVFIHLSLRVLSFSETSALLGGTANVKIETQ